jgi:hypothetical protein
MIRNSFWIASSLLLIGCAPTGTGVQAEEAARSGQDGTVRTVSFTTEAGTHLALDISPNGRALVFDLLGQLWTLPVQGGPAEPLAGTDDPILPGAIHLEMEELVAAGLTPLEAVAAATGNAARILGAEADLGTIEEGKLADLILLERGADPLADIRDTRRIWKVIRGGEVVDRQALVHQVTGMAR